MLSQQPLPCNIILIGFMGSGKSTLGNYLSQMTGFTCYDIDTIIEQMAGQTVQEVFSNLGEAHFRSLEKEVIASFSKVENAIISCGGGVVLDNDNVNSLRKTGKLVWLKANPETIHNRLQNQNNRPLLKGKVLEDIRVMLQQRLHLYEAAADYSVITDNMPISDLSKNIFNLFKVQ